LFQADFASIGDNEQMSTKPPNTSTTAAAIGLTAMTAMTAMANR
jgi:hypothetical protein